MFVVSGIAGGSALTTLEAVKAALDISSTAEDTFLGTLITRASAAITRYIGVAAANDGSRRLGRETLVETFRPQSCLGALVLSRHPVSDIASVSEAGTALETGDYELAGRLLRRLTDEDELSQWAAAKIVVTYTAGWVLPGTAGRDLPEDIEDAAIRLIKAARSARTRDPLVKAEDVPGVLRTDYWVGSVGDVASLPPDVADILDGYRTLAV